MKKEEILEISRKENKNKDLAELEAIKNAAAYSSMTGAIACCVILILASVLTRTMLYSPWFIYFSMIGTNWTVRSIRLKKRSDMIVAAMCILLALLALAGFILRILGVTE